MRTKYTRRTVPGREPARRRQALLAQVAAAGRQLSDAAVMFHSAVADKLGLGPSDWKTLSLLERHGPLTAGELSKKSGLAPPSVTGILDRLERRGWVRREPDSQDGRRVTVVLDQAAAAVDMGTLFGGLMRRLGQVYERYTNAELERLVEVLTEIARQQREATLELQGERADSGDSPARRGRRPARP